MNEQDKTVSFLVFEATQARNERNAKRFIIAIVACFLLLVGSNMAWLFGWLL